MLRLKIPQKTIQRILSGYDLSNVPCPTLSFWHMSNDDPVVDVFILSRAQDNMGYSKVFSDYAHHNAASTKAILDTYFVEGMDDYYVLVEPGDGLPENRLWIKVCKVDRAIRIEKRFLMATLMDFSYDPRVAVSLSHIRASEWDCLELSESSYCFFGRFSRTSFGNVFELTGVDSADSILVGGIATSFFGLPREEIKESGFFGVDHAIFPSNLRLGGSSLVPRNNLDNALEKVCGGLLEYLLENKLPWVEPLVDEAWLEEVAKEVKSDTLSLISEPAKGDLADEIVDFVQRLPKERAEVARRYGFPGVVRVEFKEDTRLGGWNLLIDHERNETTFFGEEILQADEKALEWMDFITMRVREAWRLEEMTIATISAYLNVHCAEDLSKVAARAVLKLQEELTVPGLDKYVPDRPYRNAFFYELHPTLKLESADGETLLDYNANSVRLSGEYDLDELEESCLELEEVIFDYRIQCEDTVSDLKRWKAWAT